MSYWEVFGVQTGVGVDVLTFFGVEQEQDSQSMEQEWSQSLKNVTPLISSARYNLHKKNVQWMRFIAKTREWCCHFSVGGALAVWFSYGQ